MSGFGFMITDAIGALAAVPVLALFMLLPGWVIGHAVDLMSFRHRRFVGRALLAILLSFAISPSVCYLLARVVHPDAVWLYHGVAWFGAALHVAVRMHRWQHLPLDEPFDVHVNLGLAFAALWVLLATASLIDFQWGDALFPSWIVDQQKHMNVAGALLRTGIPPANASYAPEGQAFPLFYYYFWHQIPALAGKLAGYLSVRSLVFGTTIWSGVAVVAAAAVFTRYLPRRAAARR